MNFLDFYPSILVLHFGAAVFFLPEEINPLPVGMKTGYVVHSLITYYAFSSVFSAMASIDGFLTLVFTIVMEVTFWLSFVVFGVAAKSLRFVQGLGAWLQDDDTQTVLLSAGETLQEMNDTTEYRTDDIRESHESDQTPESIENAAQTDHSRDEDISRFNRLSDGTQNKVEEMWEKAFGKK